MLKRVKVFGSDSAEAMAKIQRELGEDACIISTHQVPGGIEMIASRLESADETFYNHKGNLKAAPEPLSEENDFALQLKRATALNPETRFRAAPPPPRPAPAQSRSAPQTVSLEEARLKQLEDSIGQIKSMLATETMTNSLRSVGASAELISIFLAQSGAVKGPDTDRQFGTFLARRLAHKGEVDLVSAPRIVVTLGPSGAGKTTVLAQLAAQYRLKDPNARLTFLNTDTKRIGAGDQLRAYGRILDVPVATANRPADVAEFCESADHKISVFIDMPSDPDDATALLAEIEAAAGTKTPLSRIGIVASNFSAEAIEDMLERYPQLDSIVLTKLNETGITLRSLCQLSLREKTIGYLSNHSHLTRGLMAPKYDDIESLLRGSLQGPSKHMLQQGTA